MTDPEPLNIKVIYTASNRERKRIKKEGAKTVVAPATGTATLQLDVATPGTTTASSMPLSGTPTSQTASVVVTPGRRDVGRKRRLVVGTLNLFMAAVLCYSTWWLGDSYVFDVIFFKTPLPIPQQEIDEITAQLFGIRVPPPDPVNASTDVDSASAGQPRFVGDTARLIIGASAYGWLTMATIAACAIALSGGALLGRAKGVRWFGTACAVALAGGLGWGGWSTWQEFGSLFPTDRTRLAVIGLVMLATAVGLAWGGRLQGLARLAGVSLILAAATAVTGLYLLSECDAVETGHATPMALAIVFAVHSFYGWFLLPISRRLPR